MELILEIVIVAVILIFASGKSTKKGKKEAAERARNNYGKTLPVEVQKAGGDVAAPGRVVPNVQRSASGRVAPSIFPVGGTSQTMKEKAQHAVHEWAKNLYEADGDKYTYDNHSLDYCDSDLPNTEGISFKDLKPGADELEVLIRFNNRREKQLEQALQSRG